ncbi:MAG TPA: hypothetical protein VFQ45_16910 [Longimicrobium sp.]|nr:hypothetical protein [Longimicrobium sp.]
MSDTQTHTQPEWAEAAENFVGEWHIRPDQCHFEVGGPPADGLYRVVRDGNQLRLEAEATVQTGQRAKQVVIGVPDGQPQKYPVGAGADGIVLRFADARTLESEFRRGDQVVARASRVVSEDGRRLTVTQHGATVEGKQFTNTAVYERA